VGKTAIVEGLAQRILQGEVPEVLQNKRLLELNINSLVAGSKYRVNSRSGLKKSLTKFSSKKMS
jgi:ATP-dependent Clp protease ATP-binding subunit ClpC